MKGGLFRFGEFDVCIRFYSKNVLVIISNAIPGIGTIIYTEKDGSKVDCEQRLGPENEMLTLLATILAGKFNFPAVTFVFSFHPSKMRGIDVVKQFTADFAKALDENLCTE
jgi:hypothetical protein